MSEEIGELFGKPDPQPAYVDPKAPILRAILTDLIAELRYCPVIPAIPADQEPLRDMADRAEARLREVGDE